MISLELLRATAVGRLLWVGAAVVLLAVAAPASKAQEEAAPAAEQGAADPQAEEQEPLPGGGVPDVTPIDEILEEDESVIAGGGYTYDRGTRRDPFRSLLERRLLGSDRGPRKEGKAGLLIDELTISGIISTPDGAYAQVVGGSSGKSYLLRQGDELYDGDVIAVETNQVVFKQMIDDPAAIKPFREVIKPLDEK